MRLIINASNLRFGGGKTVGMNIIDYYVNNKKIEKIFIIVPVGCGYEIFKNSRKVNILFFPKIFNISVFKIFSNYIVLPLISLFISHDYVFSLGNIAFPSYRPQFLLIHQPYLAYPESSVWQKIKQGDKRFYFQINAMIKLIKWNLKYARIIGVQTDTMKERMKRIFKLNETSVLVIPNAVSFTSFGVVDSTSKPNDRINLLFLSKYYPHKNFEILINLAELIRKDNLDIKISITLNEEENESSRLFLQEIADKNLENIIVNLGNISLDKISETYSCHNGLFLPTLLESFSGTYIEAMYFGIPIFTSDMDFARDVCKDAAYYFDPMNENDILKVIQQAFKNPELMKGKIELGKGYIKSEKTWQDIGKYIDLNVLNI